MKKIILIATICVAGFASAKNGEEIKPANNVHKKEAVKNHESQKANNSSIRCMQVGLFVWCTGEYFTDTMCWGAGSGTKTYEQATADENHNGALLNEYICGSASYGDN